MENPKPQAGFQVFIVHNPLNVQSSSSQEEPTTGVHVDFVLTTVHSYFRQPYCGGSASRVLLEELVTITERSDFFHHGMLVASSKGPYRMVARNLSRWLDRKYYKQIAEVVVDQGRRVSDSRDSLLVEVKVAHKHIHVETQTETEQYENARGSTNEYGMVAATESSIKGLKRKRIATADEEEEEEGGGKTKKKTSSSICTCAVCFEDLPTGSEATSMPCQHLFHGECINTWLRTSHCCPVCRFKLPTGLSSN